MITRPNPTLLTLLQVKDNFLPQTSPHGYNINLELEGEDSPHVKIFVNKFLHWSGILATGINQINFTVTNRQARQMLKIVFDNKGPFDTVLDDSGNIVKDKTVGIKRVMFDSVDIKKYIYKSQYKDCLGQKYYCSKLGINGCWRLYYKNPPTLHLANSISGLFSNQDKAKLHEKYFKELTESYRKNKSNL